MSCRCDYPGCELTSRPHHCSVCGTPHYTTEDAAACTSDERPD